MIPFNFIPERSEATPGLWNVPFSALSASIASIEAGSFITISPSAISTSGILNVYANSNVTDYIAFTDTSNLHSDYLLGSHTPAGLGDGISLYDVSGATTIVTFSKQSTRYYNPIYAPVFDAGGASFNVKSFGAVGDGVTDDTAAFRLAISAASAINGGVVIVPSSQSRYVISSTLTLIPNLTIAGGGGYNPGISFSGGSAHLFSFLGTAEAQECNTRIQNLSLYNPSGNGVAIRARNFQNFYLEQLEVSNWSIGIWMDWGIGAFIDQCNIVLNKRGVFVGGPGLAGGIRSVNSSFMDSVLITACKFAVNKWDIVDHGSNYALGQLAVYGSSFFESAGAPVSGKSENIRVANRKGVYIQNNWFENPQSNRAGIVLTHQDSDGSATTLCSGGLIATNDFLFTGAAGTNGVLIERASGIVVTGNNFEFISAGGTPVRLSEATHASTVIGNTYMIWQDVIGYPNPIISTNSIHQIIEKSNRTSSLGTTLFEGAISIQSGSVNLPMFTVGSNRSVGFYAPLANVVGLSSGLTTTGPIETSGTLGFTALGSNPMVNLGNDDGSLCRWQISGGNTFFDNTGILRLRSSSAAFATLIYIDPSSTPANQIGLLFPIGEIAGTALAPAYTFSSETSLGWYRSAASVLALSYGGLGIKAGTNASCGTAVLGSNGSVNVATNYVKTGDLIFLTDVSPGGTIGTLEMTGIRNASGFTIASTNVADTSTVAWLIVRPT